MQVAIKRYEYIKPGDITWTHCSACMGRTYHLFTGTRLVCLRCHPEQDPRKEAACLNRSSGG